ncbi:MAG: exostosin family protein [Acidimicrobiales bacterium]|nr:exostosin family protein [Acidimicrobiales bacterium]
MPEADLFDRHQRLWLVPIVRAHLDADDDPAVLADRYGSLLSHYVLCGPDEAEVALLPRLVTSGDDPSIRPTVDEAERRGLRTLVFGGGDLEPVVRSAAAIVVHPGPTRGAQPDADVLAQPYFVTDRWRGPMERSDTERPSVAFCGQGASRPGAGVVQLVRRGASSLRNRGRGSVVPAPVRGHIRLRARALASLARHPGVDDRFVIRDRYRAGGGGPAARARAEEEFDDNLRCATYALCVRGTGNFSARFYEALSFGRVPLFVNTSCVLPFEDEIIWRDHVVWADDSEVEELGDRLVAAHSRGVGERRLPHAIRLLWEQRLSQDGYFSHLPGAVRRLL